MLGERLGNRCPGVHRALMEVGRGSSSVPGGCRGPTLFRSHFSNFSFAPGRVFQIFCPLWVLIFKFVHSRTIEIGYPVCSKVPKMRFCVRSR